MDTEVPCHILTSESSITILLQKIRFVYYYFKSRCSANQEEKTVAGKLDRDYWHQHFEELLKKLNLAVDLFHLEFKREIHQGTGEIMVSIINKETGEILRQVPPEKILDMVAEMLKQLGLTVDVQA